MKDPGRTLWRSVWRGELTFGLVHSRSLKPIASDPRLWICHRPVGDSRMQFQSSWADKVFALVDTASRCKNRGSKPNPIRAAPSPMRSRARAQSPDAGGRAATKLKMLPSL